MSNPYADSFAALLTDLTVYRARASSTATGPYVVLHTDNGTPTPSALQSASDWRSFTWQTTSVSNSPEGAEDIDRAVETKVLDRALAVTGAKCAPIRNVFRTPIERDDDLPTPLFMARSGWHFTATPA